MVELNSSHFVFSHCALLLLFFIIHFLEEYMWNWNNILGHLNSNIICSGVHLVSKAEVWAKDIFLTSWFLRSCLALTFCSSVTISLNKYCILTFLSPHCSAPHCWSATGVPFLFLGGGGGGVGHTKSCLCFAFTLSPTPHITGSFIPFRPYLKCHSIRGLLGALSLKWSPQLLTPS